MSKYKEVFLRQLINAASDALDKVRFESNLDAGFIRLVPNKRNKTICIIDNGIGMTKEDLVKFLDHSLIFFASMVGHKLIVTTKHNNHEQYISESHVPDDLPAYTITKDINGKQLGRGTKITIFLKDDQLEYLEEKRINDIVKRHSIFATYPIYLWTEKTTIKDDDEDKDKDLHEWQLLNECASCSQNLSTDFKLQAEMEKKFVAATSKKLRNHIPDDLALLILSKLPLKSLKRFGCACKSWAVLFENPHFTNKFMFNHHCYYDDTSVLLHLAEPTVKHLAYKSSFFLLSCERFQNRVKLDLPISFKDEVQEDEPALSILGCSSVNGIICLYNRHDIILLWNPTTGDFKVIPPSPGELSEAPNQDAFFSYYGFGYDRVRDDYKVIRHVTYYLRPDDEWVPENDPSVEIYSLRNNSWKIVDECMTNSVNHGRWYLDGICHWFGCIPYARYDELYLVSFDLSNEMFVTTPAPLHMYEDVNLVLLNGSITFISEHKDTETFYISMLGELGVKESWTTIFTIRLGCVSKFFVVWKKGNIFLEKKDAEVECLNLNTHLIEKLGSNGEIIIYKESFIPFLEE